MPGRVYNVTRHRIDTPRMFQGVADDYSKTFGVQQCSLGTQRGDGGVSVALAQSHRPHFVRKLTWSEEPSLGQQQVV
ncbi:hypothetical protein GCM10009759_04060 [Kitasatospora saccharophila]|uniref:Uncharacterized protein n=1 Tax=Kitasatospora saccharophila TaxID=407973 RepID=A0ABN2W689_9ACTN